MKYLIGLITFSGMYVLCCGIVYIWEEMECILEHKILYTVGLYFVCVVVMGLLVLCVGLCKVAYEIFREKKDGI